MSVEILDGSIMTELDRIEQAEKALSDLRGALLEYIKCPSSFRTDCSLLLLKINLEFEKLAEYRESVISSSETSEGM